MLIIARAGVEIGKIASIEVGVLLSLVGALLISLSLLAGKKL